VSETAAEPAGEPRPVPTPTWSSRMVQLLGVTVLRGLCRFCFRARMRRQREDPPRPCVFACNHRSFLDPPLVGVWWSYPISYFARASLWKVPVIGRTLRIMYGIPVERDNPGLSSMKGAVERLRAGISVLVFPEGTRTKTGRLGKLRDGPGLFARRADVPIVPVYVHRTERAWPRGWILPNFGETAVEVRFGRSFRPPAHLPPRQADRYVTVRLEAWMRRQERELGARRR
jgi:1-acyl-sn-glycerol-3-phosphate acyltransferase